MGRNDWTSETYVYVDLTAGPGVYPGKTGTITGSPLLAIENMVEEVEDWRAWLCERDPVSAQILESGLAMCGDQITRRARVIPAGHEEAAERISVDLALIGRSGQVLGLIYADPNGTLMNEEIETAVKLSKVAPKLDILLHLSATTIKRCRTVFGYPSLVERLKRVGKSKLLIREPDTSHQWTFCLLTDAPKLPEWKARRFYDSASPQGAAILERLNLPTGERRSKGQFELW